MAQVARKKSGGFFRKLIFFLLAFILGAVTSLGGVLGIGYYFSTKKTIKQLFGYVNFDYTPYLSEEYASKTVWTAVGSVIGELSKLKDGSITLNDVDSITPMASSKVTALTDALYNTYGIQLNEDGAILSIPLSQIKDHVNKCVEETPVAHLLSAFGEGNAVLDAICYGVEGEDYIIDKNGDYQMLNGKEPLTIGGFAGADLEDRINALPITSLMDVDLEDEVMRSLAYGPSHRYEIVEENGEKKVVMNNLFYTADPSGFLDDNGNKIDCKYELVSSGEYLLTFEDGTKQFVVKNEEGNYDVYKAIQAEGAVTEDAFEKGEPLKFKATTLGDLEEDSDSLVNSIPLKEVLDVDHNSHGVLVALACGQENVDFYYTYDEYGNKTGIEMISKGNTIGDLRENSQSLIDDIYLSSLIEMDPHDSMVMYLHYGKKDVHYQVELDDTVTALQRKVTVIDGKICNEYGEELPDVTIEYLTESLGRFTQVVNGETYVYYMDKNNFVENEKTELYLHKATYEFYHLYDENGDALYYKSAQLKDLTNDDSMFANLTGRLSLDDIVEIEDNTILKHMHDVIIDDLPDAIEDLTIGEVFETDIYYTNEDGEFTLPDGTVVPEYQKVMRPMWKYMLTPNGAAEPNLDYKLTSELNDMIDNMQNNVRTRTLLNLVDDGIISPEDTSAFTKVIPEEFEHIPGYEHYAGKRLGDLNIEELIQLLPVFTEGWAQA